MTAKTKKTTTKKSTTKPRAVLIGNKSYGLYINGEWTDGRGGSLTTISPSTEKPIAEIALADSSDVDRAVAALQR